MKPAQPVAGGFFALIERGLDAAERFEQLGPRGGAALVWEALPQATKERILSKCCKDCGQPDSLCECCDQCGFTPCACPDKFPRHTIDAEGFSID
jgi:hypothetical protein